MRKSKRVKTPRFIATHAAIWAVVISFATFSAAGWWVRLSDASVALAVLMVAVAVSAACIVPVMIPVFERTSLGGKALAGLVILVFGGVDAASGHHAFLVFESRALAGQVAAQQAVIDQQVAAASAEVSAAQARLDALPGASQICIGHGPQNCAARLAGLAADREALTADRDAAQARLDAIDPVAQAGYLIDYQLVWIGMIGIQIALVLGVLVATSTSHRLAAEAPQVETVKRKRRRKPAVRRKKPVVVPAGPRLVVDNTAP
jgi:hypothetical protein